MGVVGNTSPGVMNGKAEDFWLLRGAEETRAGCVQRAEQEVKIQTGGHAESLVGMMAQAEIRPGWSRQATAPWAYVERAPEAGVREPFSHPRLGGRRARQRCRRPW